MPRMKAIREDVDDLMNKVQLADASAAELKEARNREVAEKRRTYAIARERRLKTEQSKLPSEMAAREGVLMPNFIKHAYQDMIVKIPLDNPRIKIIAFDNYEHLGNSFYALTAILPVRKGRARVEKILKEMDDRFQRDVITPILQEQRFAARQFRKLGETMDPDSAIQRSNKPIVFDFRSRNPRTSKWLNWCAQADSVSVMLLKLAHFGMITERDYEDRVTDMVNALNQFAKFVYQARATAFRFITDLSKRNADSKEELTKVKQDLHDNESLEISESGELSVTDEEEENVKMDTPVSYDTEQPQASAQEAAEETQSAANE